MTREEMIEYLEEASDDDAFVLLCDHGARGVCVQATEKPGWGSFPTIPEIEYMKQTIAMWHSLMFDMKVN